MTMLGAQYDSYEPLPGLHVNGKLTMGENIADLPGITIALKAYHISLGGKPAPVLDGFTGDQRFFLAFGQIWRPKIRDGALRQQMLSNPHSPPFPRHRRDAQSGRLVRRVPAGRDALIFRSLRCRLVGFQPLRQCGYYPT